jgi:Holliday junction resolvase
MRIEEKKIRSLVREYEKKGYQVKALLPGSPMPRIAGCLPDLIATKRGETILVSVKTQFSDKEKTDAIKQLAEYAKSTSNVRFDLVVTNPRTKRVSDKPLLLARLRESLLTGMEKAAAASNPKGFCIVAGLITQDIIASVAARKEIPGFSDREVKALLSLLRQKRVISSTAADFASEILRLSERALESSNKSLFAEMGVVKVRDMNKKLRALTRDYEWQSNTRKNS